MKLKKETGWIFALPTRRYAVGLRLDATAVDANWGLAPVIIAINTDNHGATVVLLATFNKTTRDDFCAVPRIPMYGRHYHRYLQ